MKKLNVVLVMFMLVFGITLLSAQQKGRDQKPDKRKFTPAKASLVVQEKNDLLYLREEEKLAKDVDLYAFDRYGLEIFRNISSSEQRHADKVLEILEAYDIVDRASGKRGVFKNSELQNLYNSLIKKVDISLLDALLVGVTIEDLDIKDIEAFKSNTTDQSILNVYDNLECGSRNHLRAYYSNIKKHGGDYIPQYISKSYFNAIVNSKNEKCGKRKI